jgi:HEAT repeat protein
MSSPDDIIARIQVLKNFPGKHLMDPGVRELVHEIASAAMSLPDDEAFLAELLEKEYDSLGNGGEVLVCLSLHGPIAERRVRDALPVLNRMLVDPRTISMHEDLAETLGEMGDESCVPYLIRALSSPEVWVRAKAARSLAHLGDRLAIEPLIAVLRDDSDTVRENAIKALVEMGSTEAIEPLVVIARSTEESTWVRSQAILALGHLRAREAMDLLRMLRDREEDEEVKEAAAEALASLGDSQ